jgi:hypothetical protein
LFEALRQALARPRAAAAKFTLRDDRWLSISGKAFFKVPRSATRQKR